MKALAIRVKYAFSMAQAKKSAAKKLTVIDFFCGAGGFSEGFRQQGYTIVAGIDNWRPAVRTFNHNFGLDCEPVDVGEFDSLDRIRALPNTDIIIGSPPCTSFSHSNRSGGADKTEGISLIELYLKVVAVKMWQPRSRLKAWYMENVTNSKKYVQPSYSFADLGLAAFAKGIGRRPSDIALAELDQNWREENAADYGVAQTRERLITGGVVIRQGKEGPRFELPEFASSWKKEPRSASEVLQELPQPLNGKGKKKMIADPNYPKLKIGIDGLADYSYDTGIFHCHWEQAHWQKRNHPYMGNMSFPEDLGNPSRTITATRASASREALIYDNDNRPQGHDGRYRTPTIREIAVLMSYPISYQFDGHEDAKWRLVGNSVAPLVSAAIAKTTKEILKVSLSATSKWPRPEILNNLNSSKRKSYAKLPAGKDTKRFRRHLCKADNMTTALTNYSLEGNAGQSDGVWRSYITFGTGRGYRVQRVNQNDLKSLREEITEHSSGRIFMAEIDQYLDKLGATGQDLTNLLTSSKITAKKHPISIINRLGSIISKAISDRHYSLMKDSIFGQCAKIRTRHLFAIYAFIKLIVSLDQNGR